MRIRLTVRAVRALSRSLLLASPGGPAAAQEVTLAEPFKPGHTTKVEVQVKLTGKLVAPFNREGQGRRNS